VTVGYNSYTVNSSPTSNVINGLPVHFRVGYPLPTVSGTALTYTDTYYAKDPSVSFWFFFLYRDAGLTDQVKFMSNTSTVMESAYYRSLTDKSRWTTGGVERIYGSLKEWNTARAGASDLDEEVAEIGHVFADMVGNTNLTINIPAALARITTSINGVRTAAFHNGSISSGFVIYQTNSGNYLEIKTKIVIDGIRVQKRTANGQPIIFLHYAAIDHTVQNCIIEGYSNYGWGIQVFTAGAQIRNNLIFNCQYGVIVNANYASGVVNNNTITKCTYGIYGYGNTYGYYYHNLVIGNTANWMTQPGGLQGAGNNLSPTGQGWVTTGKSRLETTDTSPFSTIFADWTNNNFAPASINSPQVERSFEYYGMPATDIKDAAIPSYPGPLYNTDVTAGSFVSGLSYTIKSVGSTDFTLNGASAITVGVTFKATGVGSGDGTATLNAKPDVGCYEFDLGYGEWPVTYTLTVNGLISGTTFVIYDDDSADPQSLGTQLYRNNSSGASDTFIYEAPKVGDNVVVCMYADGYKPYQDTVTLTASNASYTVKPIQETN